MKDDVETPKLESEESFDVQGAVEAIEAASATQPKMDKEDSFDLEAQIKAIDAAVEMAQT
jgi:hypothetical protein